ncbi:MAG: hypothetical protein ACNA7V_12215 [Bacteroidales bacterium]
MDKTIHLIFRIVSIVLIALAVVFQVIVLSRKEEALITGSVIDTYSAIAYVALILAALLAIAFPLIHMIRNPKSSIKMLISIVGLVIVGIICYSISVNTFDEIRLIELKTTAEVSKTVGAALYFTYIVGGLAVLSIIYSGVSGFFK